MTGSAEGWTLEQQMTRLAHGLDEKTWDTLGDFFSTDVECRLGRQGSFQGREALVAGIRRLLEPLDTTQHVIGSFVVEELRADQAATRCYVIAQHVRAGATGGDQVLVGGLYRDRFVREDGRWVISNRRLDPLWSQGNRAVIDG